MAPPAAAATTPARLQEFYRRAGELHLAPLWEVMQDLVTAEPGSAAEAALWSYDRVRPYLLESAQLVDTREAERRVLVLENPGLAGQSRITTSLYAGLQIVLAGELARPHRHSAAALRFVIEGDGATTSVDGRRIRMGRGDFVVTPSWSWHEHSNEGSGPVVWLDALDVHVVNLLGCSFKEDGAAAPAPAGAAGTAGPCHYPYAQMRAALARLAQQGPPDPHRGHELRYTNPVDGLWAMPTISTWTQLLPAGWHSAPYRSTDGAVYVVVEGRGHSLVGARRLDWQADDVFVVPGWHSVQHVADTETVLFGCSDRVIQEKLGLWREDKAHAS